MINKKGIRNGIIRRASKLYGYPPDQIKMVLCVGHFFKPDRDDVIAHLKTLNVEVISADEIVEQLLTLVVGKHGAKKRKPKMYVNDPVIVTLRLLDSQQRLITS
jgi:exoribonuclease II